MNPQTAVPPLYSLSSDSKYQSASCPGPRSGRPGRCALVLAASLFVLHLVAVKKASAQGVVRDSIGAVSSGRGGTNIAHDDNLSLILDNPAGIVDIAGLERTDIGLDILATDLDYRDPHNNANGDVVPFPLPTFGYVKKSADGRLAYGFGVFASAGFGAHYDLYHGLYGKREYSSLGALVRLLPAVAYRVTDRFRVGATFGLGISHAQLEMPFNFQTGLFKGFPAMLDLKATGLAPIWSAGMQYDVTDQTTVGLTFTAESRFRMKGDADADVSGFGLPVLGAKYDTEVDLVWPRSVGFGVSHRINRRHRVSGEVVWTDWSHAFDKVDLKLTNGTNPLFNTILGKKVRDTLPVDWNDALAFRFGYEYLLTDRDILRAGYIYHNSPIPNETAIPLLSGTLEHAVSIGYGHQWETWRMDVGYQYSWGPTYRVGRSRIVGGDFDNSSIDAQAHWLFLSVSF